MIGGAHTVLDCFLFPSVAQAEAWRLERESALQRLQQSEQQTSSAEEKVIEATERRAAMVGRTGIESDWVGWFESWTLDFFFLGGVMPGRTYFVALDVCLFLTCFTNDGATMMYCASFCARGNKKFELEFTCTNHCIVVCVTPKMQELPHAWLNFSLSVWTQGGSQNMPTEPKRGFAEEVQEALYEAYGNEIPEDLEHLILRLGVKSQGPGSSPRRSPAFSPSRSRSSSTGSNVGQRLYDVGMSLKERTFMPWAFFKRFKTKTTTPFFSERRTVTDPIIFNDIFILIYIYMYNIWGFRFQVTTYEEESLHGRDDELGGSSFKREGPGTHETRKSLISLLSPQISPWQLPARALVPRAHLWQSAPEPQEL